jgi:hypothetical protein|nr:MAG TPA: hypothetical protein [Caudoviricetes sp.]
MIIVSQDKKSIINLKTIDFIDIMPMDDARFEINANFAHCITELGYYDTEERAKEVFEEIIKTYTCWENFKYGIAEGIGTSKYEMPKE